MFRGDILERTETLIKDSYLPGNCLLCLALGSFFEGNVDGSDISQFEGSRQSLRLTAHWGEPGFGD